MQSTTIKSTDGDFTISRSDNVPEADARAAVQAFRKATESLVRLDGTVVMQVPVAIWHRPGVEKVTAIVTLEDCEWTVMTATVILRLAKDALFVAGDNLTGFRVIPCA